MKKVITSNEALRIAIRYASLENVSPSCEKILNCDGLYEILLRTLLMRYEFYVDAATGEVLGFNNEPEVDAQVAYGRLSA